MARTPGQRMSDAQEKRLEAKHAGGQRSAASGAFWSRKGDVRTDMFLIEAKATAKKSMSIKKEWLEKIRREAIMESRMPLLVVEIDGLSCVMLLEDDFDDLLERAQCGKTEPDV